MTRLAYILTILVFFGLVSAKFDSQTGFTSLIRFGQSWQEKRVHALENLPIAVAVPESGGYDGQFYAQIATDPFLRNPQLTEAIDIPSYRARRILVPAVAALAGGGSPWWTLQAYALINIVCWFAFAWFSRTLVRETDWVGFARWIGCTFSMGALESVRQSLVDLPALLLLTFAIHAHTQSNTRRSTLYLALSNLTKETAVLGSLALHAGDLLRPGRRRGAFTAILLAAVPLGLWWLYVAHQFPPNPASEGFGNFSWPFVGLFSESQACLVALAQGNFDGRFSFGLLAVIGLITQAVTLWLHREPTQPWWRVGAAYTVLLPFLGLWVWSGYWAACRALLPLTIAFNLLLPTNRAFWPLWVTGNITLLHAVWRFL